MARNIPTRIVLGLLCATGVMELYISRTNLSLSIVKMAQIVNSDALDQIPRQPYCLRHQNLSLEFQTELDINSTIFENTVEENSPIKLTTTQRGIILASFFYTYGFSGIIGGLAADKYGTKLVLGIAVLLDAVSNLLIPIALKYNYIFLILIRSMMGFTQGMCYPSIHSLLPKWIPKEEHSRFIGFVYIANCLGTIFSFNICGLIISDYGWEAVFYFCGILGLIWLLLWIFLMHETPETHPRITQEEKKFILQHRTGSSKEKKRKTPWKKMLTSLPLWAINVAHSGNMFSLIIMLTQLPLYMNSIIGINIKANGFLSSLPFLSRYIGANSFSWLINLLIKKRTWNMKTWQRICTIIGFWCSGLSILFVGYVGCNSTAALCLLTLMMFFNGASCPGYLSNHLQIAPNFAGTLFGLTNSIAFIISITGPVIVGALTPEETISEWINVYWVAFGIYFVCGSFYMIFLSTSIQPWNDDDKETYEKVQDKESDETF